jgi:two-component system sensor histidine kinase/response regulator
MPAAQLPISEARRLQILHELDVLDTQPDAVLDGLVRSAAQLLDCPVALVCLLDEHRQWFMARHGLDITETPREQAICAHTILQEGLLEVPHVLLDPRFSDNPLVTGEPHIGFYAGVPLVVDGERMGTLCVLDHRPREITEVQRDHLRNLARAAEYWLQNHRLNEQLRRADAERRSLFEQMGDGMLLLDHNYRVIDANRPALRMLGYQRDELLTKRLHTLMPVGEHARLSKAVAELAAGAENLTEWQLLRQDRTPFTAEVSTRAADGQRCVVVVRDITQRRAQEQHLKLLSMAVEQNSQSIVITDLEARMQYVNAAALSSSGYGRHELLGFNPSLLQSGMTPPETFLDMWEKLLAGQTWRGLLFNRRKDGGRYVEYASIAPIRDAQGRVTQYLAMKEDVTEKRRMNGELKQHQLHLEELVVHRTVELEDARRAAEAGSEAKSVFLANMSHEIRTPMNGVVGLVDVLQQSSLTPYQKDLTETISESAFALLGIIEDILDFSKIEAGHMTLESEPVCLSRLVDSVYSSLRVNAASRSVALEVHVDPELPDWIRSDSVRLRQILNNLVGNAIKFSVGLQRAGRVELRVELAEPGCLRMRVIDNGIGMAPDVLTRILDPFVQAEASTTRRYGGTGLGLSICRRIAQQFGGRMEVESEPDRGSTFTVTLPCRATEPPGEPREAASVIALASGTPLPPGTRLLVLVAEDNDINQKVISRQLALLGLDVDMAHDGMEALALWREGRDTRRHCMLLTDLHMPGLDGYALATAIRSEEPDGQRLPIVALSANAMRGEIDRCKLAGMDDYLSKPVQLQPLGALLQRWIRLEGLVQLDGEPLEAAVVLPVQPLAVFDDQALSLLVGDDPETLAEFQQRFMHSAQSTVEAMRQAVDRADTGEVVRLSHRLTSSSRAMGAMVLAACCEAVERAGVDCQPSLMKALMVQMEDALAQVTARLLPPPSGQG